jgi:peroxiredoxin
VIVLYRGAWCPYRNLVLRTYQENLLPELDRLGVALIAISPQRPDGSLSIQEKNELAITVLSDSRNQVAEGLGVLTAPNDDTRRALLAIGADLTELNGDGTDA